MLHTLVSNEEKSAIWKAFEARRPTRVPVLLGTNPRVVIMNPNVNHHGWDFYKEAHDPKIHVEIALHHALYCRTVLNQFTDHPTGLPDVWDIQMMVYNVYEAACLGAPVDYQPDQVPCTEPFLTSQTREEIFKVDIEHPLETPFVKRWLNFWHEMEAICKDLKFEGRPVRLTPWSLIGSDGPVTAGCNIFGSQFIEDLIVDPDFTHRFMEFFARAAINRRRAFWNYWGDRVPHAAWMADDSIAMISTPMYVEQVMPIHRMIFDAADADNGKPFEPRGIHLCGSATHHFPTLKKELNIMAFDTGFPVDHGALRRELGPDVLIQGGPQVALLLSGTPEQVFARTREILLSGIKEGGRFILREGNNLPPNIPEANLQAMYEACLEFGRYDGN